MTDGHLLPLVPRMEAALERGVVDTDLMPYEAFQDALRLNAGHLRRRFLETNHLVEDAILELRRLGVEAQREPEPEEDDYFDEEDEEDFDLPAPIRPETIAAIIARQGNPAAYPGQPSRNGPCPCGSGKKYKRCCGR